MIRSPAPSVLLKGLLGASLALNLVLGGLLWWRAAPPPPPVGRMQAHIERLLPEPDRGTFHQAMEAGRPRFELAQDALRDSQAAVRAALTREPFDPAALRAAMAASRERWGEFGRLFEDSLAAGLSAISPEGRRLIAEDMARDGRRRRGDGTR
ncbi:MAG TPA: periplasmic heavy metal sensor [Roseomonas sp.]|nr:periplasmic heavy metal sensor [Roseomonas sp.]